MVVNISNVLVEEGHKVLLVVSRKNGILIEQVAPNVNVEVLNKKSFWDLHTFWKILKIVFHFRPDVIHSHSSSIYWSVLIKILLNFKFKLIYHEHNGNRSSISMLKNLPLVFSSILFNSVIVVNENLYQWSRCNLIVKKDKIYFINNFPLLKKISKISSKKITILSLANLRPVKDQFNLIKALSILVYEYGFKNVELILAGKAYNDLFQHNLKAEILNLNIANYVTIYGQVNKIEEMLGRSDIGVLSSVYEGLPVSLLEYGLGGLPVVVTDVGQCSEVIGNGKYGIVVPPKNPQLLAQAISRLILNLDASKELGLQFKKHVINEYGPKKFLRSYHEIIFN